MSKNILVAVAWPYANSQIHVGNITGSTLPADIFARYHRLVGNRVIMVSGSDAHGTPVTVRADAEGTTAAAGLPEISRWLSWSSSRSWACPTICSPAPIPRTISRSPRISSWRCRRIIICIPSVQKQWFAPSQGRFLPDRYVEGTCYICGIRNARGDQCDSCGSLLDATQLIDPRSKIDGSTPELRETEHFYLDLGALRAGRCRISSPARRLLAAKCAAPIARPDPGRWSARSRHHSRPGLGYPGPGPRLGR